MKKALISPMEQVATGYRIPEVVEYDAAFDVAPPLYWLDCDDTVIADVYFYNLEAQACEVKPPYQPTADENKAKAMSLLKETDWTQLPSVSDPAQSTPYLTNAAEFAVYRSAIRDIAVNPVAGIIDWPVIPSAIWSQ